MQNQIKVLIVDDEEIVVQGIKKGLEFAGFYVKTAIGGENAINILKDELFDLVIVDLVMPGMNGVETCKAVKKISSKIEVLLLSGYPQEIERLQMSFVEAGGKDLYLRKPLLVDEVKEAIYKLMCTK
ncbi:response regulator [Candidatus Falkowbacteria bacterium]|nr:response regulator [Candidatus Falkowbacteria bacterium]